MAVSFDTTKEEDAVIMQIARRAQRLAMQHDVHTQDLDWAMDVTAVHANDCKLDLDRLLAAEDFEFSHDLFGIRRHLNRDTGKLEGCFLPRFAQPVA